MCCTSQEGSNKRTAKVLGALVVTKKIPLLKQLSQRLVSDEPEVLSAYLKLAVTQVPVLVMWLHVQYTSSMWHHK